MKKNIITTILKKGHITGEDVGRLYVANACHELKTLIKEHKQSTAFTQAEFDNVANRLTENEEIKVLNYFICLMNSVKSCFNITNGNIKNVSFYIMSFLRIIDQLNFLTLGLIDASKQPKIMTQLQYDLTLQDIVKNEFDAQTYYEIVLDACYHYVISYNDDLKELETGTHKPKPDKEVDKLLNKYNKEPVKNKELIELLRKCDIYEENVSPYITIEDVSLVHTIGEFIDELDFRNIPINKDLLEGIDVEQEITSDFINKALTPEQKDKLIGAQVTDTEKTPLPETFTKYELISNIDKMTICEINIDTATEKEKQRLLHILDLFLKELPELKELVLNRLNKIPILKGYVNAELKDYLKIKIKWEDLIKTQLFNYEDIIHNYLLDEYPNGIAIIKKDTLRDFNDCGKINTQGEFEPNKGFTNNIFEDFSKQIKELVYNIPSDINLYKKSGLELDVLFVKASNMYIDLFNEVANIPDLDIYKHSLDELRELIETYNQHIYTLLNFTLVEYGRHGHLEEARELRKTIRKSIPYFKNVDDIQLKEEKIKEAREAVKDRKRTEGHPSYSTPLFILVGDGE